MGVLELKYAKQVARIAQHLQQAETTPANYKLGVELEHFLLDKTTLKAVSYYEEQGIEALFKELIPLGWKPAFEGDHLVQLSQEWGVITLEPGGQIELSIQPQRSLAVIEQLYIRFLTQLVPLAADWQLVVATVGYQPESSIGDIPLVSKQRYTHMYDYFKAKGKYAHNMMKGTASLQVSVDYCCEEDFRKKLYVANYLSPLIYTCFDNSPFFEGKPHPGSSIRGEIWNDCDEDRCGTALFSGYESYARHLLAAPPIILLQGEKMIYTGGTPLKELFEPESFSEGELAHVLSMQFLDVRARNYLELRMGDALPLPYSMGYIAFWNGLLYDPENLHTLYQEARQYSDAGLCQLRGQLARKGLAASVGGKNAREKYCDLLTMAERGLPAEERGYLAPLQTWAERGIIPKKLTLVNLEQGKGQALDWCLAKTGR